MLTKEQIDAVCESQYAKTILKTLLENPANFADLNFLSSQDVRIARLCDGFGIKTSAQWRELSRHECGSAEYRSTGL